VVNHYSRRTRLFRKLQRLRLPRALVFHADVRKLAEVARAFAVFVGHGADEHAESGFEGCHWGGLGGAEECVGHVVYHLDGVRMDWLGRMNGRGGLPCRRLSFRCLVERVVERACRFRCGP
jgi:hypothetical protein